MRILIQYLRLHFCFASYTEQLDLTCRIISQLRHTRVCHTLWKEATRVEVERVCVRPEHRACFCLFLLFFLFGNESEQIFLTTNKIWVIEALAIIGITCFLEIVHIELTDEGREIIVLEIAG